MLKKYCKNVFPPLTEADIPDDNPVKAIGIILPERIKEAYSSYRFHLLFQDIFTLISSCNKYIDDSQPWTLFKNGEQKEVEKILYVVLESVRFSAFSLAPIVPNISNKIYHQLGYKFDFNNQELGRKITVPEEHWQWGKLSINQNLPKAEPIFVRVELTEDQDY